MDNTEQDKSNSLKCSICYGEVYLGEKGAMKWNQDTKEGYGVCNICVSKYREKKKKPSKLENDSYNYITSTIRQILNRHSFNIVERTDGSLRLKDYILWNAKATSPNGYIVKVRLEVVRKEEKDYKYNWEITLYNAMGEYIEKAESETPNVPYIKEFLGDFMKKIGSDPYEYFISTLKSILVKYEITLKTENHIENGSEYYIKFKNGFQGYMDINREGHIWKIRILRSSGVIYSEYKNKSLALPPLREFFAKKIREIMG